MLIVDLSGILIFLSFMQIDKMKKEIIKQKFINDPIAYVYLDTYFYEHEKELTKNGITKDDLILWKNEIGDSFINKLFNMIESKKEVNEEIISFLNMSITGYYELDEEKANKLVNLIYLLSMSNDKNGSCYLEYCLINDPGANRVGTSGRNILKDLLVKDYIEFQTENREQAYFKIDSRFGGLLPYFYFNKWYQAYERLYSILKCACENYFTKIVTFTFELYNFLLNEYVNKAKEIKDIILKERFSKDNESFNWNTIIRPYPLSVINRKYSTIDEYISLLEN